jgi:8-oxo-dGTP pyrophosphatase MutT (NUDIX family)
VTHLGPRASLPRPSASVILVRDGGAGLETLMVRRHARSPVAPSAYVFPGGTVRADDAAFRSAGLDPLGLARRLSERADTPVEAAHAVALYVCALRELFEEAGVLLVRDSAGRLLSVDHADRAAQERIAATRLALQARELSLAEVLADAAYQPAFDLLVPFSHWVTPAMLAARFDTRFFVAEMPAGQAALHDTIEISESVWLTPAQVIAGDYHVVYATGQHLRRLAQFDTVGALLEFAREKRIRRLSPEIVEGSSGIDVFIRPDLVDAW